MSHGTGSNSPEEDWHKQYIAVFPVLFPCNSRTIPVLFPYNKAEMIENVKKQSQCYLVKLIEKNNDSSYSTLLLVRKRTKTAIGGAMHSIVASLYARLDIYGMVGG